MPDFAAAKLTRNMADRKGFRFKMNRMPLISQQFRKKPS